MSARELALLIGDDLAGWVKQTSGGQLRFTYDDGYRDRVMAGAGNDSAARGATPVSVSMPAQVAEHPDRVVAAWLWGLLPDSDAVIRRWSRDFQVSGQSPFSLLATPLGEDCPGAIRLVSEQRLEELRSQDNFEGDEVVWLSEGEVAQRLRDLRQDATAWLGARDGGRFSLAGAQSKTALLLEGDRWGDPRGRRATNQILKPAIVGFDDHDLNEHLCLTAMRIAGLPAVHTRVERFEDQSAIVVKRYDRVEVAGRQVRVHQEDLCQALSVHPAGKYQNDGGPSARDIASLLRRVIPEPALSRAVATFADALIWNWIIAGTDAHAKNYSILLSGSQVRLAPLYDVASALPYDIPIQKMRLAMKFGSGYSVDPGSSPWKQLATELGLSIDEVRTRAVRLTEVAGDAFAEATAQTSDAELGSSLPEKLTELVTARAAKCRRVVDWV